MITVETITNIAVDWAIRCFGREHVFDVPVRSLRLAEEAVELAQACGVPKEKMLDLVEITYRRPRGEPLQEIGGVMLTAAVFCNAIGIDADDALVTELRRVLEKTPKEFAERNQSKMRLGLD